MTIEEFIRARLDEDEAAARAAGGDRWAYDTSAALSAAANGEVYRPDSTREYSYGNGHIGHEYSYVTCDSEGLTPAVELAEGVHIARHDPARVLRQVAALRLWFDLARPGRECRGHPGPWLPHDDYGPGYCRQPHEGDPLRMIAAIWDDHPDYQEDWKP